LTLAYGREGGQGTVAAGGGTLAPGADPVWEFLKDSAPDFEEAKREEAGADLRVAGHGPCGMKAEARVVQLMKMTGWKVVAVNSSYNSRAIDIVARKGRSTYVAQCVFGEVAPGLVESYVSQYLEAKGFTKADALMVISPRAEVPAEGRTALLLRYRRERIEFLGERDWVAELRRPTIRASSTTNTELTLMSVVLALGAVMVLAGLYLGLNFLLVGAGYIIYIFGAIGVIVGTWYKYRNL